FRRIAGDRKLREYDQVGLRLLCLTYPGRDPADVPIQISDCRIHLHHGDSNGTHSHHQVGENDLQLRSRLASVLNVPQRVRLRYLRRLRPRWNVILTNWISHNPQHTLAQGYHPVEEASNSF